MNQPVPSEVDGPIITLRDQKVILDPDLSRIYGVATFRFNEAVKRNLARFPADFMFRLSEGEWRSLVPLRSQIAILKPGRGQHRKHLPYAFTEHGAVMAANILRSPRACARRMAITWKP
jgi:ORF6N domain-containing protein